MLTSLRVVVPPAVEPVSLAEAKFHLRIDHDSDDGFLPDYITVAREYCEQFLNRALITQTLSWTIGEAPITQPTVYLNPIMLNLPPGWPITLGRPLQLPRGPVQSVVSVMYRLQDGTTTTIDPAAGLYVDLVNEPSRITLRNMAAQPGSDVTIVYVTGYGATSAQVPMMSRHAIKLMVAYLYEHRGDVPQEVPGAVMRLLWPDRMVTFG